MEPLAFEMLPLKLGTDSLAAALQLLTTSWT